MTFEYIACYSCIHHMYFRRRVWTRDEDEAIRILVSKYGIRSWSSIAEHIVIDHNIHGRSGKQCRERWHNHLDPFINKNAWTEEEESTMADAHKVGFCLLFVPGAAGHFIIILFIFFYFAFLNIAYVYI